MEPVIISGSNTVLAGGVDVTVRATYHDGTSQAEGYDFQHPAVLRNVPPPTVRFDGPLRWWLLDRRWRVASIMRLRDQPVEDILRAGGTQRRPGRHTTAARP
ncbi:MAG: hypothetical protein U0236_03380 [Nitrospira sp.]